MNEDAATNAADSKDHPDENMGSGNKVEFNDNDDMDVGIEVIAEVVDGVAEVVKEASKHCNEIESAFEASPVEKNEIKIAVQCAERVDLEVVIEEQLDDSDVSESSNLVDEIKGSLNDDQTEENERNLNHVM